MNGMRVGSVAVAASAPLAWTAPRAVALLLALPLLAIAFVALGVRCRMHLSRFVGSR